MSNEIESTTIELELDDAMVRGLRAQGKDNEDLATLVKKAVSRSNLMALEPIIYQNLQQAELSPTELQSFTSKALGAELPSITDLTESEPKESMTPIYDDAVASSEETITTVQVTLSKEMVIALQMCAAKNEDLPTLVSKAVARTNLKHMMNDIHQRLAQSGATPEELEQIVTAAIAWAREQRAHKG